MKRRNAPPRAYCTPPPSCRSAADFLADATIHDAATGICMSKTYADGSTVTYAYDAIGNSIRSVFNSTTNICTANGLNQYASIVCASASPCETAVEYDLDGNMTQCGDWTYTCDAANRLKTVSSNGVLLVTNFYDAKGCRVRKVTAETTTKFFYDGWNLLEERVANANGTASTIHYYWGKDLSGTLQGAGGVGIHRGADCMTLPLNQGGLSQLMVQTCRRRMRFVREGRNCGIIGGNFHEVVESGL